VLDTEVERRLERARAAGPGEGGVEERLRTSLFQRLFTLLREREQVDGIRRTVTLDVQYRMHPVLGEFVSRTFYEPHGEGFRSGGAPESFAHGLARYGNASAAFVHVPRERGTELRGRSKSRPAEARWMATEVRRILDERPELSVGVVAFYRAQIDLLNQELAAVGVTEALDDGGYRVRAEWKAGHDGRGRVVERLRVGTVDAFQGREFDVVLLSMARCNTRSGGTPLELRRRLGHLMLENRLCVAMSRQRRLLVVVGDREMIEGSDPGAVPALARFLELCDGEHGVRFVA
jgi:superfamily I DNA and/or RNA helicase